MVAPILVALAAASIIAFGGGTVWNWFERKGEAEAEVIKTKGKAEAEWIAKQPPKAPEVTRESWFWDIFKKEAIPQSQRWEETQGAGKEKSQTYESGQIIIVPTGQAGTPAQPTIIYTQPEGAKTTEGFNWGSIIGLIVPIIIIAVIAIIALKLIK